MKERIEESDLRSFYQEVLAIYSEENYMYSKFELEVNSTERLRFRKTIERISSEELRFTISCTIFDIIHGLLVDLVKWEEIDKKYQSFLKNQQSRKSLTS